MAVRVLFVCVVTILLVVAFCQSPSHDAQADNESRAAFRRTQQLYTTLRNIAFPESPVAPNSPIENRFILLTPGKVLNYFDYFPGREYTTFLQDYDTKRKEAVVPPHVMERWFDLADMMPNPNPFDGQDTGKSLANVYASILHEIRYKGLNLAADQQTAIYNQAVNYLMQVVADPEDPQKNSTRLALYERYRDQYNDRKLDMENEVQDKRMNLGSLDYELWFQRLYPSLNAKVESAYTKWLVFGQKEMVELYIADLDTGSSGQLVEEARMALRASAVTSLDRTRTIYPVSFEPSDWYKYLLPPLQRPSRDQLLQMMGTVNGKLSAIDAMISKVESLQSNSEIATQSQQFNSTYKKSQQSTSDSIQEYMTSQYNCMAESPDSKTCDQYHSDKNEAIEAIKNESQSYMEYYTNPYTSRREYLNHLNRERDLLQDQLTKLYALLGEASPYLGGVLDASTLAVANITDAYKDDEWLQFEFDSSEYQERDSSEATQESVSVQTRFHFLFFSAGGSYSHSKNTEHSSEQFAKSNMKVKGELLRVNIKRPWFKPEVFDDPNLTYKESDGYTDVVVSPGYMTEAQFINELSNNHLRRYKLPEYATAFLLGRNIELEFSGLDSLTVSDAMQESSHSEGHGGFLFFSAGASVSKSKQTSKLSIDRTADGMRVKIPGAQVIGYYTQLMPAFPTNVS